MRKRDPKAKPRKKYKLRTAGRDTPSKQASDFRKADRYKKTPQYRSDVRRAATKKTRVQSTQIPVRLDAKWPTRRGGTSPTTTTVTTRRKVEFPRPLAERQARVRRIESKPEARRTVEEKAILHDHESKVARNKVLKAGRARFTGAPSTRERGKIDEFLRRQRVARVLGKDAQEKAREQEMDRPKFLPGTAGVSPGGSLKDKELKSSGLTAEALKAGDREERERRAKDKLAVEGFKAGATRSEVSRALMSIDNRRAKAPVGLKVLHQLMRPSSAVIGGLSEVPSGNPVKVAKGVYKGAVENNRSAMNEWSEKGGPVGTIAGLTVDILVDPLTYVTVGTAAPAMAAARAAAKKAGERALAQNLAKADVEIAVREAAEKAWQANGGKARALRIGMRGSPVRGVSIARQATKTKGLSQGERVAERGRAASRAKDRAKRAQAAKGTRGVIARATQPVARAGYRVGADVRSSRLGQAGLRSTREVQSGGKWTSTLNTKGVERVKGSLLAELLPRGARLRGDDVLQELVHSYRPREFFDEAGRRTRGYSPVEWDLLTAGAREGRAGFGIAERLSERAWRRYEQAFDEAGIPETRWRAITDAIEGGTRGINKLKNPEERQVARLLRRDYESNAELKIRSGAMDKDQIIRDRTDDIEDIEPPSPEAVVQSTKAKAKAERAAKAAEKEVRVAEAELARMQGRSEILSRNVSGVRGEKAAQRKRSDPQYAGGGVGVKQAKARLAEAEAKRADALETLATQRKSHAHIQQLKQEAKATRLRVEKLSEEAQGWVPRIRKPLETPDAQPEMFPRGSTGTSQTASSLQRRKRRQPLAHPSNTDYRDTLIDDPRLASALAAGEAKRVETVSKINDRLVGLGHRVTDPDQIDLAIVGRAPDTVDMHRFYIRTERGDLKPVFRLIDNVEQLDERLVDMVSRGEEIIEIPRQMILDMQGLLARGRTSAGASRKGSVLLGWDAVTRSWKWIVTQPNPQYHIRNLMGDLWNARIGGATLRDVSGAARIITGSRRHLDDLSKDMLRGVMDEPTLGEISRAGARQYYKGLGGQAYDAEVALLAERHGVLRMGVTNVDLRRRLAGEEIEQGGYKLRPGGKRRDIRLRPGGKVRHPGQALKSFNEGREDLMRLASFMRALRRGDPPEAAASWANKHHFDYSDLTSTETNFLRRVFPFYTFMARNTPLQLAGLIQSPGRFASFEKMRNASAELAGIDQDWLEQMPEYVQAQLPFAMPAQGPKKLGTIPGLGPVPGTETMGLPMLASPMLPVTDLNNLDWHYLSPRLLSSLQPFFKMGWEMWNKYDIFYRDKIRKDLVPAPVWMESKDAQDFHKLLFTIPGTLTGKGEPTFDYIWDRRTGKKVIAWPWWMDKLYRSTPITGLVAGSFTTGRDKRPGDRALSVTNWLTGVRRAAIDPTEARTSALFDELEAIEEQLGMDKPRRTKLKTPKYGGRIRELMDRQSEIQKELNQATTDFAVPYFETGGKGKKGGRKKANPYATSSGGGNPYAPGGAKDNPYR